MKVYHLIGKVPYCTNCYLMTDNEGNAVLFDCSIKWEHIEQILKNDKAELKAVFMTHGHEDHRECLEDVLAHTDAPMYMAQEDIDQFRLKNFVPIKDKTKMEIGQIKIFAFQTPGHTPGGMCYKVDDMLISGDTLFAGTVGRTDLDGGDYDTLIKSLRKIVDIVGNQNVKVMPGHAHLSTFNQEKVQNVYLRGVL